MRGCCWCFWCNVSRNVKVDALMLIIWSVGVLCWWGADVFLYRMWSGAKQSLTAQPLWYWCNFRAQKLSSPNLKFRGTTTKKSYPSLRWNMVSCPPHWYCSSAGKDNSHWVITNHVLSKLRTHSQDFYHQRPWFPYLRWLWIRHFPAETTFVRKFTILHTA